MACFLALRLEVDLQRRLDARKVEVSWTDLMRDLDQVRAVSLTLDGEHYLLRTNLQGAATKLSPPRSSDHHPQSSAGSGLRTTPSEM